LIIEIFVLSLASTVRPTSLAAVAAILSHESRRRLLSAYILSTGVKIWLLTEAQDDFEQVLARTPDDEVTQQALHYRQGLEFERKRESERSKAEERRITQTDAALSALAAAIAQSHQGVLAAVSKPRKATIHRDPKTGKVIGASSVTED